MLKRDWMVHFPERLLVEMGEEATDDGGMGCDDCFCVLLFVTSAGLAETGAKSGFLGS